MQKRTLNQLCMCCALIGAGHLLHTNAWAQGLTATPTSTAPSSVQLKLTIPSDSQGTPSTVFKVPQHTTVNLEVMSEQDGELHLHAYRLSMMVKGGEKKTLSFKAKASGKFNIKWHPKSPKSTKDMNATTQAHHAHTPPLASLEVQPQ